MPENIMRFEEHEAAIDIRDSILNNIDISIYVTDMETNKLLFVNSDLKKQHKGMPLVGETCWQVLKNRSKRCEQCPIPYLLKNPGRSYKWETYQGDKRFQIYDCIIPWTNGKLAHLQYMVEIA